jgi:hypothetical protein
MGNDMFNDEQLADAEVRAQASGIILSREAFLRRLHVLADTVAHNGSLLPSEVDLSAHDSALRLALETATRLAYIGDHHFPDLTWKARCDELAKDLRTAERERDEAIRLRDLHWREVESLREWKDKEQEERGRQYGLRLQIADEFAFLRELLVAVVRTGTKDPLLDARLAEELRSHE